MSQNPTIRRAYVVHPRQELIDRLLQVGEADSIGIYGEPSVVMTEPLPYEGKLEGYRSLILSKCKEAYLIDLFQFSPFSDALQRNALLGEYPSLVEVFDKWWVAEEANTLEIETTW